MKEIFRRILSLGALLLVNLTGVAAEYAVSTGDQDVPTQVAEPIRAVLSVKPIQLMDGEKPVLRIWFRNNIPLKSKPSSPASALEAIAETTLMGVVSVEGSGLKDYKDNDIPKGVFTVRFVMQPQDGDHLGTAEFNTFILLLPTEVDKALDSFTKF